MSAGLGLFVLFALLAVNFALNVMEVSVIASNRLRVRHLAESGSRRAQSLQRLQDDQERFLAAVVFLVLLTVGVSAFFAPNVTEEIVGSSGVFVVAISVVLITIFNATIGDLTPKVIGVRASTSIGLFVAPLAEAMTRTLGPFIMPLYAVANFLARRVLRVDHEAGLPVSEAELRFQIQLGAEAG
ncbi:MAG TPA: DUF21 domain-containing protein, partial [Dehalococcoidia bacterium]